MKKFKQRASKGSVLLTAKGAVSKAETPKSYVKEWLISEVTGKYKSIDSKYLRRGIVQEDLAIERISKFLGFDLKKNEEYFEDEYFTGTPDIITEDCIIDAKCSWDAFTFPYFMEEPPMTYLVQLQIYMELIGVKKAKLAYCLENGIEEQINKLAWSKSNGEEPTIEHWDEAEKELNYDHLPDHLRIKTFDIDYNEGIINNLKSGIVYWRNIIDAELTKPFENLKKESLRLELIEWK